MGKKRNQTEKMARKLLGKASTLVFDEGEEGYNKMCELVDTIADLLVAGRLSDIDPAKSEEEMMKYMEYTQHLMLHGVFLSGMQYEKDAESRALPDSSPGSFDDISIDDFSKGHNNG